MSTIEGHRPMTGGAGVDRSGSGAGSAGGPWAAQASVLVAAGHREEPLVGIWTELLRVARGLEGQDVWMGAGDLGSGLTLPGATAGLGPTAATPLAAALPGVSMAAGRARSFLEAGFDQLVIVPLSLPDVSGNAAVGDATASSAEDLAAVVGALRLEYPGARIHDLGSAVDEETAAVLHDVVAAPQEAPEAVLAGAIVRGFDGEPARLATFVALLERAVPADTTIALRGSTVMGHGFLHGAPHDAAGPGSSDLDLVLMGETAVDLWVPDARLLGGINTLPLSDKAPWVAPALDGPRREAQAVARRPLAIQAMARWFLDLRAVLQAQRYVVLAGPS